MVATDRLAALRLVGNSILHPDVITLAGRMAQLEDSELQRAAFSLLGDLAALAHVTAASSSCMAMMMGANTSPEENAEAAAIVQAIRERSVTFLVPIVGCVLANLRGFDEDNILSHSNALWCAAQWALTFGGVDFARALAMAADSNLPQHQQQHDPAEEVRKFITAVMMLMCNDELACYSSFRVNALLLVLRVFTTTTTTIDINVPLVATLDAHAALFSVFAPLIAGKSASIAERCELWCRWGTVLQVATGLNAAASASASASSGHFPQLRAELLGNPIRVAAMAALAAATTSTTSSSGPASSGSHHHGGLLALITTDDGEDSSSSHFSAADVIRTWRPLVRAVCQFYGAAAPSSPAAAATAVVAIPMSMLDALKPHMTLKDVKGLKRAYG